MKWWSLFVLTLVFALGIGYLVLHRQEFDLTGQQAVATDDGNEINQPVSREDRPANIVWQNVERPSDGFKVQMPVDLKQIQIPAYNENGGTDPVAMIFSNPDAETTFSVAWADNPPVARVNNRVPNQTLETAREGAVMRTQTTLVNESATSTQGFPGREFAARNAEGGVMNSRLIYAGSRLYMLVATFPSSGARRDQDVARFFNSFVMASSANAKAQSQSLSKAKQLISFETAEQFRTFQQTALGKPVI